MFENKRHVEDEEKKDSRRSGYKHFIKTNCEGFEGMNYEQLRQPYMPRSVRLDRGRSSETTDSPEQEK